MRSIFVLLILVMIGLNGKGQSVTALPDSVLSQCCLEVTLLNGNVTTVDWVFIQYITRDGTGTKLFVEYAPNFGGIQWETQIRIQDDFDEVLQRSKFIMLPFTVGSTDYAINRNWIANIEENTTTGGTWVYGRFGTPTKRKFSAVEDYETLKNLLLACRPRAIVVAENGLYTEGDTVRMGGFLIEPTTITTEGYNWQMKDTLSSVEFGLDYNTPGTGDTTVYWSRRFGSLRQMMQMGRQYWHNKLQDTISNLQSTLTHSWGSGDPFLQYITFSATHSVWIQASKDNSFWNQKNLTINPYYTLGFQITPSIVGIGVSESGSGDPGNGVIMGAYGFGTTEYLFMKTKAVDNNTATNGQFLQLIDNTSGEVDFATIDLSGYLEIADTAAMLDPYIRTAGWGLVKSAAHTLRVDSTLLATRSFAKNLPTYIANTQIAYSNGSNLVGSTNLTYSTNFSLRGNLNNHLYYSAANANSGNVTTSGYLAQANDGSASVFRHTSSGYNATGIINSSSGYIYSDNHFTIVPVKDLRIATGASLVERMRIWGTTGNVLIQGSGTYSDISTSIFSTRSTTKASSPFPLQTLAQADAITGVQGNFQYETTQNGLRWYNGIRKAYALESTFARGTSTYVPFFDANGQLTQDVDITWNSLINNLTLNSTVSNGLITLNPLTAADGIMFVTSRAAWVSRRNTSEADYSSFAVGALSGDFAGRLSIGLYTGAPYIGFGSGAANRDVFIQRPIASQAFTINFTTSNTERFRFTNTAAGFFTNNPQRHLHVEGEARITDLTTDTPTRIVGADADGDLGAITVGAGLSLSSGTLTATTTADGNGIYTGSGTLSQHTTRALIPSTGNLFFSQKFNSNADSAYFNIVNYLGGERAVNFGLTDTSSTGYSRGYFESDGAGNMNWTLETNDANGSTTVRALEGALSLSTTAGNISLSAPVDQEIVATGLVRAKQEAYYEINSTSSPQNLSDTYSDNFINQGGTQASFTLVFPASPEDGQILKITYNNAISSLTLDGNGNTIVGTTVTTAVAGSQRIFKFYAGDSVWIRQN